MEFQEKNVCVVGCGKSGISAAQFLIKVGAKPFFLDGNEELDVAALKEKLPEECKGLEVCLGQLPKEKLELVDMVVPSPGVPLDIPLMQQFEGKPVLGEIELAYQFEKGSVVAITGTNGKTTTTTLMGEIMKAAFPKTFVVGNIGIPYTEHVLDSDKDSVTVGEISSFQLETILDFHPRVSAILNITPDHLNRHHTMENYIAAKNAITKNQTKDDTCVLNYEDAYTRKLAESCPAKVVFFSSKTKLEEGVYLDGEDIYVAQNGTTTKAMNIHEMNLVGTCNVENVMAAIAMSLSMGVSLQVMLPVIRDFKAVPHRIEYAGTVNDVLYYNDSKATNPDAAIQGIRAMSRPTILIGGGYDKQNSYDEWIEAFDGKVKLLVLIGQTRDAIAKCAREHGFDKIVMADTFEEAFQICVKEAVPGDAVLLSPACASWGMFPNYEVRGDMFKEMVAAL